MEPLDLFLLVAVGAGAWTSRRLLTDLDKARASCGWPFTTGHVVRSEVVREAYAIGETEEVFVPAIEYAYTASGREWCGRTVSFAPRLHTTFRGRAEDVCRRYVAGADVAVYYDPADPGRSCLEPAAGRNALGGAAAGATLVWTIGAAAALLTRVC